MALFVAGHQITTVEATVQPGEQQYMGDAGLNENLM